LHDNLCGCVLSNVNISSKRHLYGDEDVDIYNCWIYLVLCFIINAILKIQI